eukprot:PhF_6_TR26175/c0_g1_i1/m.37191
MPSRHEIMIQRLGELGYTKALAKKALKACNNDLQQAADYLADNHPLEAPKPQHESKNSNHTNGEHETSGFVKMHPCVVQYGFCKYEKKCKYATLPGYVCLNHIHGGCAFGASCRQVHTIDGVDLRELFPEENMHLRFDPEGKAWMLPPEEKVTTSHHRDPTPNIPAEPSHNYPVLNGPSPFLSKAMQAPPKGAWGKGTAVVVRPLVGVAPKTLATAPTPTKVALTNQRHPCISQCGSCKFGEMCLHRHLRADICVHWLNGRCRNQGDTCQYRHTKDDGQPHPRAVAAVEKAQKQTRIEREAMPPPTVSAARIFDTVPVMTTNPSGRSGDVTAGVFQEDPEENFDFTQMTNTILNESSREAAMNSGSSTYQDIYNHLHFMFPTVYLEVLHDMVERHRGDIESITNEILLNIEGPAMMTTPPQSDEHESTQKSITMLTLLALFPDVEVDKIEAALEQNHYDFAHSCRAVSLLHTVLMSPLSPDNEWTPKVSAFASDRLRYEKFRSMYGQCGMDEEIFITVWDSARGDMQSAIESMNDLVLNALGPEGMPQPQSQQQPVKTVKTVKSTPTPIPTVPPAANPTSPVVSPGGGADWVRCREEAYSAGVARQEMIRMSVAAFRRGDRGNAKLYAMKARDMFKRVSEMNAAAMQALEASRSSDLSILDLHGFHVEEALEVLDRRVNTCLRNKCKNLRVVTGYGHHSKGGAGKIRHYVGIFLKDNAAHYGFRFTQNSTQAEFLVNFK